MKDSIPANAGTSFLFADFFCYLVWFFDAGGEGVEMKNVKCEIENCGAGSQ